MKLPTTQQHRFGVTPGINIQRSKFDRSHGHKTTFDSGLLIPVLVDEVLPGDTFNLRASFFARLSTPLKPILDNMYLDSFFFFVPNRLLWTNWEKFNGAQDNPGDSTSFTVPYVAMPAGGPVVGTLFDYFGLPNGAQITGTYRVDAFWSRAYNQIWNAWFRDENLQNSVTKDVGDGPDTYANYVLKRRGKRHDYFTSCLPWPQKGTAVSIPAGASTAPVNLLSTLGIQPQIRTVAAHTLTASITLGSDAGGNMVSVGPTTGQVYDPNGSLFADLSSAFATTINQLRLAEQTQVLLERDARGGTRYAEILKSHFGVTSPDARLQRPEYLGGGSSPVNFHPVPNTAVASGGTAAGQQGNLAAFATSSAQGHGFNKSFTEHGVIIGLVSVRADITYQQGVDRMFSRSTRYDFFWPALAQIGEQSVLNGEIWTQGTGTDSSVFGYQERFAEYRTKKSVVSGKFHSDYATPLDVWHLSQRFTALPTLGDTFIADTPPVSRIVAVTTEPQFFLDSFFDYKCARPLPVYGIPTLGGRL
ncbi:MAG: major capsid protein [Microvirus sp.]|nr:MAG: major capsid protein [Microvirus sp.]